MDPKPLIHPLPSNWTSKNHHGQANLSIVIWESGAMPSYSTCTYCVRERPKVWLFEYRKNGWYTVRTYEQLGRWNMLFRCLMPLVPKKINTNVCLKLNELNLNVFVGLHSDYKLWFVHAFLLVHKLWLFHVFLLVHSQHNLENAMRKLYSPHLFKCPRCFFRKQQAFILMVRIILGESPKKKMFHIGNMFTYISLCSCGHVSPFM